MNVNQTLALILLFMLASALLGKWILIPAGILALLLVIRALADFYWMLRGD